MNIVNKILEDGEYYKEVVEKNTIYLHHTAGGHHPDYVIDGWEFDKTKTGNKLPVATAYVIGGISITDGNSDFDGAIYKCFDDKYWAHHLGTTLPNNNQLNKQSIAIEMCNYGSLIKTKDGRFVNYIGKPVPASMVTELAVPYRSFKYYHSYTDKQLWVLADLIMDIAKRYPKINVKAGLQQFIHIPSAFEVNQAAQKGTPGIWSHSNVRPAPDKHDIYPHPKLISLIQSL